MPGPRNHIYKVAPFSVFLRKCSKYRRSTQVKAKPTNISLVRVRFCSKEWGRLRAIWWRGSRSYLRASRFTEAFLMKERFEDVCSLRDAPSPQIPKRRPCPEEYASWQQQTLYALSTVYCTPHTLKHSVLIQYPQGRYDDDHRHFLDQATEALRTSITYTC